jgi:hypothetical protein
MIYKNDEVWQAFHPNENFDDWLKWRLSVDAGETKSEMLTIVRPEVAYVSPTTNSVITSDKARKEDLKRSGCIEYDPEMKTDQKRRIAESEAQLDKVFDATIDKAIDSLPSDKRARLESEMTAGLDVDVVRTTL